MGLLRSAFARAGWPRQARKSSLVTRGRLGSAATGPGPLGGGIRSCPLETHAVPLSGAKSGGVSAADAGNDVNHPPAHATTNTAAVPLILPMRSPPWTDGLAE